MKTTLLALALAVVTGTACQYGRMGMEDPRRDEPRLAGAPEKAAPPMSAEEQRSASTVARVANGFGFRLVAAMPAPGGRENLVVSPFSVATNLSTLVPGATGATLAALQQTLGLDDSQVVIGSLPPDVDPAAAELPTTLPESFLAAGSKVLDGQLGASGEFNSANSVWLLNGVRLEPVYEQTVTTAFGAYVKSLDHRGDAALPFINGWVNEQTKGRIPTIFEQLPVESTVVLVNALTFDGKWQTPFNARNTEPRPFTFGDGTIGQVESMVQTADLDYAEADGTKMLGAAYRGGQFRMELMLPPVGADAAGVLRGMTAAKWDEQAGRLAPRTDVQFQLPKFTLEGRYDLPATLSKLGMAPLFESADLTRMSRALTPNVTYIGQVVHKTYIKVDEEGTEAAAATGTVVGVTSAPSEEPAVFIVDRPFLFAIRHVPTGALLFLGVINDPQG